MGIALEILRRYGPVWALAGFLIYIIASLLQGAVAQTQNITSQTFQELQKHEFETSWYQKQQCLSLAILAGTPKELCEPPHR